MACRHYQAAISAAPGHADAHLSLGIVREALGDAPGAIASYEAALAADSGNAFAGYNLGKALFVAGELRRAETVLRAALVRKPDFPEALVVLSGVLEARGELSAAIETLDRAVVLRPDYGGALRNLGMLHCRQERWADASAALARAADEDPADADVLYWLGEAVLRLGQSDAAAESFRRVLQIRPHHPESLFGLGYIFAGQGRRDEAATFLQRAVAAKPQLVSAHVGLGNLHAMEQRFTQAAAAYRTALEHEPGNVQALVNLSNALVYLGETESARQALETALALDPENAAARWAHVMSGIPLIRDPGTDLASMRARFSSELAELDRWFDERRSAGGHEAVGVQQPFWLAYQECDNFQLLRAYGRLCARLMAAWQKHAGLRPRATRIPGPVRVGVVSQYFRRHSVWDALVRGWYQGMDSSRFELHSFCLGQARDAETEFAASRSARFIQGPKVLRQWVEAIDESQPDVLVYPEVGMDPMTVKLASLRLAPVQAASWGHPETSGLPTIDYYLSAKAFEPEDAQAHYAERLISLPHLGCHVEPFAGPVPAVDPGQWGLPSGVPLLLCPGTPFKYAPEHDALYAKIAGRLGECRLCFFVCGIPELSERLRRRLALAFEAHGLELRHHVSFIPWLPQPEFYGLMQRADAILDTIGFSGFNTALQAVECGLPIVSREGRFLRGRLASGILKRIGMADLVCADEEQYVALAVRLAQDDGYRAEIRKRMAAGRHALFGDLEPIRALEEFLAQGV
jgi:predicted O-linked N-acetylglucosamine transferase (SPINDLY family)